MKSFEKKYVKMSLKMLFHLIKRKFLFSKLMKHKMLRMRST